MSFPVSCHWTRRSHAVLLHNAGPSAFRRKHRRQLPPCLTTVQLRIASRLGLRQTLLMWFVHLHIAHHFTSTYKHIHYHYPNDALIDSFSGRVGLGFTRLQPLSFTIGHPGWTSSQATKKDRLETIVSKRFLALESGRGRTPRDAVNSQLKDTFSGHPDKRPQSIFLGCMKNDQVIHPPSMWNQFPRYALNQVHK